MAVLFAYQFGILTLFNRKSARVVVCLTAFAVGGCVSTHFVPVEPGASFELAGDEALVVIQIDTDLPVKRLHLSGLTIRHPVVAGRHFWVAKVLPGPQSWQTVVIDGKSKYAGTYRVRRSKYPRGSELDFGLEPGTINYVGELIIRSAGSSGIRAWISVRVRNHAAMALRELEQKYSNLLDQYPTRLAGDSGDAFIEFYVSERARISQEKAERRRESPGG